jgi:hypothetical protein
MLAVRPSASPPAPLSPSSYLAVCNLQPTGLASLKHGVAAAISWGSQNRTVNHPAPNYGIFWTSYRLRYICAQPTEHHPKRPDPSNSVLIRGAGARMTVVCGAGSTAPHYPCPASVRRCHPLLRYLPRYPLQDVIHLFAALAPQTGSGLCCSLFYSHSPVRNHIG